MSQVTSVFGSKERRVQSQLKDNEAVHAFLARFANRQTLLSVLKGVCGFVLVLILLAMLITLGDGMRWFSDVVRWSLTCIAYVLAMVAAWRFGLRAFWASKDSLVVAHSIEQASPRFRESLLSSVELRGTDGNVRSGSDAFVSAIEHDVAKEVRRVELDELLPWTIVARALTACTLLLMVTLLLCAIPGLRYPQRLARSLLPFISLIRPSNVRIVILEPSPASLSVPSEQTLRFLVEVDGGNSPDAMLEFSDESEQSTKPQREIAMLLESEKPRRFSIVSTVGSSTSLYRIRSGDGETAWHQLETLARPKPVQFTTQVTLPRYVPEDVAAKFYSLSNSSVRGDLRVLAGSRVHLEIDTNQPLKLGSIEMEQLNTGRKVSIPLTLAKPKNERAILSGATSSYAADFEVLDHARYQLRLQSHSEYQGNPLENTFSPFYKMEAVEDEASTLAWSVSESTLWKKTPDPKEIFVVAPNELLGLSAICQDNLPVESIDFEWSLNRGPWQAIKSTVLMEEVAPSDLPVTPPSIATFAGVAKWDWDLTGIKLEGGDTIQCRVKGIDRKGTTSYSPIVTFSVSAIGYDRDRYDSLERMSELVTPLKELADMLAAKRDGCRAAIELLKNPASTGEQRSQAAKEIGDTAKLGILKAQTIRSMAEPIVKNLKRCLDQSDVELTLRNISRIEKEWLQFIDYSKQLSSVTASEAEIPSNSDWSRNDRESRLNRMQQSFDQSCDHSKRTLDLYRQFVGLELQTALTKDLTGLMVHQQTLLDRKPNVSFDTMVRSQKLSEQYCNAAIKLVRDYGPSVNQDVRDGLPNLVRWGSDTMLEIKDLCETELGSEVSDQARDQVRDQLRSRIERSANELKNQRWGYSLGGNLIWNIQNARRELWNHSGSLRNMFNESLDRVRKRNEIVRDNKELTPELQLRISTLQSDVVGPHFTALGQILDRRDLHQRRGYTDPMFASDMGLAHRAWTNVLEDWFESPQDHESQTKNLEEVSKAFQILEAAHESVEAKLMLQSLRLKEQYDWKTLEGQLTHATQWDSVALRVEFAAQWMREAGITHPLAEKFNALRYGDLANRIAQKLHPRRDPNNQNLTSASDDMQRLFTQWNESEKELKPILDAARATLTKFAPSISELAEKAAKATQRLQSMTEEIQKAAQVSKADLSEQEKPAEPQNANEEVTPPSDPSRSLAELVKSQAESERKLQQLEEALIEKASRQDLLKNEELQVARDSDNALSLLDAVSIPMNEALSQVAEAIKAPQAPTSDSKADIQSKLSEAVERESQTVEALEAIAKHFARIEDSTQQIKPNSPDSGLAKASESNAVREQQESSKSIQRQADAAARALAMNPESPSIRDSKEDYAKARDLADAAQRDPKTLLENLERELKTNAPMQSELSEIAKASAQSVASNLRNASNEEKQLASQVENADAKLVAEKQLQLDRAQAVAEQVDRFASRSLDKAAQAANATGKHEQAQALNQVSESLRQRANNLRQLNENTPRQQFQNDTQALADEVAKAQQELGKANGVIEPLVSQDVHKEEQRRVNTKETMQNVQNQNRNEMIQQGKESVDRANQRVQEAKQRAQQLEQRLNETRKQTEAAKKRYLEQNLAPDALKHLQNTAVQEEQLLQKNRSANDRIKQAEEQLARAEQTKKALEESSRADLDKPDPRAALAVDQMAKSKEQLESLQRQLDSLNQGAKSLPEPKSQSSPLANLENSQKKVKENVRELASDIDQAARHEERLGNTDGAKNLKESARAIEQVADGQLNQAQQDLGQSAKAASNTEENQAKSLTANQEIQNPFDRPGTQGPVNSLNRASEELLGKAKQLETAIGSSNQPKPTSQPANAQTNSQTSDSQPSNGNSQAESSQAESLQAESFSTNSAGEPMTDQEKARMLDQLDRQVNSKQGDSARSLQDSIRQSADKLSNAMNQDRLDQQKGSQQAKSNSPSKSSRTSKNGKQSQSSTAGEDRSNPSAIGVLPNRTLEANRDWGQLREQRAEDVVEGKRDEFDPEFNEAIQAYYRAIGKP